MDKSYFEVIRPGINTTFQDLGRKNLYHIGIPFSGAMDNRNFILANAIAGNKENTPVIEFAYQGPLLKFKGEKININITGNASFKLIKKEEQIEGNCYENYTLEEGDQLDIISTNKSVYGYLAISGNFEVQFQWNSCSTNTKAKVGANDGEKIEKDQLIKILDSHSHNSKRKLEYINSKIENIRVIKGTNFSYFSEEGKKNFFEKKYTVTKLTDRMGMRLEGQKIENIVDTNINSEGIIKGDEKIEQISAASIIAKVARDRFMKLVDPIFPEYDFSNNKGYGTKNHINALKNKKASLIHRMTFEPVKSNLPSKSLIKNTYYNDRILNQKKQLKILNKEINNWFKLNNLIR